MTVTREQIQEALDGIINIGDGGDCIDWYVAHENTIRTVLQEALDARNSPDQSATIDALAGALKKAVDWWDGDDRYPETMQTIRNEMKAALALAGKGE